MNSIKERMETVGVRFPLSDIEWLASLHLKDAFTPSDKIRAIVSEERRRHEGCGNYQATLAWLRDLLAPAEANIKGSEFHSGLSGLHSELVALVMEWLPQTLALVLAQGVLRHEEGEARDVTEKLLQLEAQLAQRLFQLCESLLRLGVGSSAPCYNPDIIHSYLPRIIELAEVISTTRVRK